LRIGLTFNVRSAREPGRPDAFVEQSGGGQGLPRTRDDVDEEFDSPETIEAIAEAIASLGHEVELLGYGEPMLRRLLEGPPLDLVWNFAEGHGSARSREARVPAVLEMLDVPYTGSDPLTLAVTLDKDCAKRLVAAASVATPQWAVYEGDWSAVRSQMGALPLPVFVKPCYEGSSKGILASSLIDDLATLEGSLAELHDAYRQPILVEEFIEGDELTVGIVGNRSPDVLGIMRVLPRDPSNTPFVYSLDMKRDWQRRVRYECPAKLKPADTEAVRAAALACWRALGCRDVTRIDFRLREGVPYFLETNPLPGLSPLSGDLVILSRQVGIEYHDLIARILQATCERLSLAPGTPLMA
jgi:D-alanine-D-alanine ligase